MPNVVRNPYSNTAGNTPPSLGNGQIAVNQADGKMFFRSSSGTVTQFAAGGSSLASYATTASFPATGSSSVLYLATDSGRLYGWTGSVYVEIGPVGGGDTTLWSYFLPPAPTGVTATAGSSQASVSWTAPTVLSQVPVVDYIIQFSSNSGSTWTTFADSFSASSSATVTSLTPGVSYTFRVAAVNAIGQGAWSSASSEVTPYGVPASPTGVGSTDVSGSFISIAWTAPSNNGGSAISDYVVQFSSNNGSTWSTFSDGVSTATSATVLDLTNATTYLFRVAAVNAAGTGPFSAASSPITTNASSPEKG